jgi:hypothetical protein
MICRRPGTPTSRVRSAVGLLLTLSSLLVWGADFASSAQWTAVASGGDAFDRDVVAAEKAAALAWGTDLRADSASQQEHRSLGTIVPFSGDTTNAPESSGNNNTECGGLSGCINGCRSRFYKVTGGIGGISSVSTCGSVNFAQRLYVWKGSGSSCSTFTCTGTLSAWSALVRLVLCANTCAVLSCSVDVRDAQWPIHGAVATWTTTTFTILPVQERGGCRNLEQSTTFRS